MQVFDVKAIHTRGGISLRAYLVIFLLETKGILIEPDSLVEILYCEGDIPNPS
jgi:hypothetical protein